MLRAIIVEDEKLAAQLLNGMIRDHIPDLQVIDTCHEVSQAIQSINRLKPDIVFLDIEMQTGTGFDVLSALQFKKIGLIFTTAYDHYALKAIKFSALDYLLKPIDVLELIQAVEKARNNQNTASENSLNQLLANLNRKDNYTISLSTQEGIEYVPIDDIITLEANGAYTYFYIKNRSKIMISKNLKEFELLLSEHDFFRVHNSFLINLREILKIVKSDGGYVVMRDLMEVPISPKKKEELMELLNKRVVN